MEAWADDLIRANSLTNTLGAYTRGEQFSLDLTTAVRPLLPSSYSPSTRSDPSPHSQVLRQGTFVQKMHDLGWTRPGRFDGDEILLQRCVARYHAFLDLISSSPSTFCVPTLDIVHSLQSCAPARQARR